MRRFAQTQIRTEHTPNLRSFLLEHSCKDDPLIASLNLIKSPIQSHSLSFTKIKDLDLDKKIEGLAYIDRVPKIRVLDTSCPKNSQLDTPQYFQPFQFIPFYGGPQNKIITAIGSTTDYIYKVNSNLILLFQATPNNCMLSGQTDQIIFFSFSLQA